jgi:CDP-paratose 2-epimerase
MLEAIGLAEDVTGLRLNHEYNDTARIGDHIWYISNLGKFRAHYPDWRMQFTLRGLVEDIYERNAKRWRGVVGRA